MIKVLELFAGIGACSKALDRLKIPHTIVDAVEIDKYAIKSFNAVHGTSFEPQDITKWDKDLQVDLVMHGSPCQDFSTAGLQAGGDKGSGTRSSLMYETLRIVEKLKPKYVIWENVKNLLSKKHRHNFDAYLETMEALGYTNWYQVLNAKDYGVPQNRERVFTVSISDRYIIDNNLLGVEDLFKFPEPIPLDRKLKDVLEKDVDERYYLDSKFEQLKMVNTNYGMMEGGVIGKMHDSSRRAYSSDYVSPTVPTCAGGNIQPKVIEVPTPLQREVCDKAIENGLVEPNDAIEYTYSNARLEEIEQGYIKKQNKADNQVMSTLKTNPQQIGVVVGDNRKPITETPSIIQKQGDRGTNNYSVSNTTSYTIAANPMSDRGQQVVEKDYRIRKLTPKECWRLMGFDDSDFEKAEKVNSNTQLYKQAGNSIVVDVLEAILKELFNGQAGRE